MKVYLGALGFDVWDSNVSCYIPPKGATEITAKKKLKRNQTMAMESIWDGLSDKVKERMGRCTSAKELWDKLKNSTRLRRLMKHIRKQLE